MSIKNHTVIEIADQCVKALQTKAGRGRNHLLNQIVLPLENQSEQGLESALSNLAKHRIIGAGAAFLMLPRQLAILKLIRLPSVDKTELRKMLEIQISNQTPYTLEEVEYDFHIIDSDTDGYTRVILFVIPREVTTRYIDMMNRAKIPFSGLTISTQGLQSWYRYQLEHKQLVGANYVALCNVDLQQTEIAFFKEQNLLFSRSSNQGLVDIRRGQTDELIRQIELSVNYYRNEQMGLPIEKLIVVLNVPDFQGFCGELELRIQIPCQMVSSLEGMSVHKSVLDKGPEEVSGVSLTAPLGVSISDPKSVINLLPKAIRETKTNKFVKLELIKLMLLGIVIY
ncbi:MAG: pilus assembly protein PilM, partial [Candidatus Omnitrophica bacterium]|nr:pilus assembly protein PilM [Candidatus Omnitrophota bacterium]